MFLLFWASFVIGVFNVCIAPTISLIIIIRAQACVCLGSEIIKGVCFCYFGPGNFLILLEYQGGVPDFCSNI